MGTEEGKAIFIFFYIQYCFFHNTFLYLFDKAFILSTFATNFASYFTSAFV